MRSMGVKKLVALGVAAAIAASPVAHAAQTFNTAALPTSKDWYLNSVVVVGHKSAPSDAVWAGNIAAAIASMAYTEETETVTAEIADAKVKLSVPGEIVVGGEGYTDKIESVDLSPGTFDVDSEYGPAKVTMLLDNEDLSFDYREISANGDGEWKEGKVKVKETLGVKLDVVAAQVSNTDEAEIRAKTEAGGMKYTLTISGVIGDELATSKAYETRNMRIKILGDEYEITKIDLSKNEITLVSSRETKTVEVGGTVEFEGYTIKVVDIDPESDKVYLQLLDEQGNEVASDVVAAGGTTDFDGVLSDKIKVSTVFAGTEKKFVKLELKAKEMVLKKGAEEEFEGHPGWYLKWDYDTASKTMVFEVYYMGDSDDSYLTFDTGLKVGDTFKFPGSAGYGVSFMGFESKPMKELKFDGGTVYFIDAEGVAHEGVLYKEIGDASITDGTDTITATVYDFIDGEKAKIVIQATGQFKDLNGGGGSPDDLEVSYNVSIDLGADDDEDLAGSSTVVVYDVSDTSQAVTVPGLVTVTATEGGYTYHVFVSADIEANTDQITSIDGKLIRVAFAGNGVTSRDDDTPYSVVAEDNNTDGIPEKWTITDIGDQKIVVPFTSTGELDFEDLEIDVAGTKVDAKADNSNPENFWTNAGTEVYVKDVDTVEIKVPIAKKSMKIFVGIPQEVTEGEEYIEGRVGETVRIGEYEVKIEDIIAEGATATCRVVKPIEIDRLVYLDNEAPTGKNLIVVGGYYVNTIAREIAERHPEIKDAVSKEEDYIVDKYEYNGREAILVFGYTAGDTARAAQEFLNWLRANVQ